MLKFEKYRLNLGKKDTLIFQKGEEERVMLTSLPKDFDSFLKRFNSFLEEIKKEADSKNSKVYSLEQ